MKQLFQDTYKQYNPASIPYLVLNLEVEDGNYDINVSVDKREVFLNNENEVLESLKLQLTQFFEDLQRVKAFDQNDKALNKVQSTLSDQQWKLSLTTDQKKRPSEVKSDLSELSTKKVPQFDQGLANHSS